MKLTHWALGAALLVLSAPAFAQQAGGGLDAPEKSTFSDVLKNKEAQPQIRDGQRRQEPELEEVRFDQFQQLQQDLAELEKRVNELEQKVGAKEQQPEQKQQGQPGGAQKEGGGVEQ